MVFNHTIVDKILDAIFPLPQNFGVIQFDDSFDDEAFTYKDEIYQILQNISFDSKIYFGMTKMVIKSPDLPNVVIKIPFNGYYVINSDEFKEEGGNVFDHGDWFPFNKSPSSNSADYCLAECEKYQQLKKLNLDCFVAETIFYKTINNTNIFIQEWITPESSSNNIYKPSLKSKEKASQIKNKYKKILRLPNENWIGTCLDAYGEEKVKTLLDYCKKDFDILEDCHTANYGYRLNDTPAFLDFSNFLDY